MINTPIVVLYLCMHYVSCTYIHVHACIYIYMYVHADIMCEYTYIIMVMHVDKCMHVCWHHNECFAVCMSFLFV